MKLDKKLKEPQKFFCYFLIILSLSLVILFGAVIIWYYFEKLLVDKDIPLVSFASYLFLWELILAIAVSYASWRLFMAYENYRNSQAEFLQLLLEVTAHKFGNFLAAQKINLSMAISDLSKDNLSRLKTSCNIMENDLKGFVELLRYMSKRQDEKKVLCMLESITLYLSKSVQHKLDFQKRISLQEVNFFSTALEGEMLLFLLLENAFRYGTKVRIRIGIFQNKHYIAILNDTGEESYRCTGLGLYLAKKLAARQGFSISFKKREGTFIVILFKPLPKKFSHYFNRLSTLFPRKSC